MSEKERLIAIIKQSVVPYVAEEIYFTDIGKTVFLTKEEAEKALKGGAK